MSFPVTGKSKYLATISRQLARLSDSVRAVYVEENDGVWSWALAHAGGPYPLLRTAARLRGVDYHRAIIGCFGHDNHSVAGDPDHEVPAVAFILKLDEMGAGGEAAIRAEVKRMAAGIRAEIGMLDAAMTEKIATRLLDTPPAERVRLDPNANPGPWEEPPDERELTSYDELVEAGREAIEERSQRDRDV